MVRTFETTGIEKTKLELNKKFKHHINKRKCAKITTTTLKGQRWDFDEKYMIFHQFKINITN